MAASLTSGLRLFKTCTTQFITSGARYRHIVASKLTIHEFGDPAKVVKKEDFTLDVHDLKSHQVYLLIKLCKFRLRVKLTLL